MAVRSVYRIREYAAVGNAQIPAARVHSAMSDVGPAVDLGLTARGATAFL
jgi:hypothetical protein